MQTPLERYRADPVFRQLVDMFRNMFETHCHATGAGLTPTEVREASGLAFQIYMERHGHPIMIMPPNEGSSAT